jgi:hypothetical protein
LAFDAMPKAGLPGYMTPGDRTATVLTDYAKPGPDPIETPTLPELLCAVRRRCEGLEAIDLAKFFREQGGRPCEGSRSTIGTIDTQRFCSVLVSTLPRMHWSNEVMEMLQATYGTGSAIATPSGGSRPSHMAWSDFLDDVRRADDRDRSFMQAFRPTARRPLSPQRAAISR